MALSNIYNAFPFKGYALDKIKAELELAVAMKQTVDISDDVIYVTDNATGVTNFPAPIKHNGKVYVDAREFSSIGRDGNLQFKNHIEDKLRFELARWEKIWNDPTVSNERLMTRMVYHIEVFSKWVAGGLTRTYALGPLQETQVLAACTLYVVGQYYNNVSTDIDTFRLQEMVAKTLYIPIEVYENITPSVENLFPRDLDEFVELLKQSEISPRLRDISKTALVASLGGSFWGVSQDRVLVSTALEYPPALYVIMSACIANTMFKKTRIGSVMANSRNGRAHENFLIQYQQIMERHTSPRNKRG